MIKKQLQRLKNPIYSVLLVDRTKEKTGTVWNVQGRTDLTIDEILSIESKLKFFNGNKKNDVYIKAEQGAFYNLVVDDVTADKLEELLKLVAVDLVICSSSDNYQAIINLAKSDYSKEQADFLVKRLNLQYGDPCFSGANHYFRLTGFRNKKAKNNNEKIELVDFVNLVTKEDNEKFFAEILKDYKANSNPSSRLTKNEAEEQQELTRVELTEHQQKEARREIFSEIAICKKAFGNRLDMSAVDFRIVKRLYKKGYSKGQIQEAFYLFTDFENRHSDPADYMQRTINNAILEFE